MSHPYVCADQRHLERQQDAAFEDPPPSTLPSKQSPSTEAAISPHRTTAAPSFREVKIHVLVKGVRCRQRLQGPQSSRTLKYRPLIYDLSYLPSATAKTVTLAELSDAT